MASHIINVYCKNGHLLFEKYFKEKSGFLLKCYIERIGIDHVRVSGLAIGTDVFCPECKKEGKDLRIGRIGMVHGMPAVIVNHGGIKRITTT